MRKNRAIKKRMPSPDFNSLLQARAGQRHLRDEIKRRHDRYRELVEQSNEGIWLCELEEPVDIRLPSEQQIALILEKAYVAECNEAMARMYGFTNQAELIGARLNQLWVPQDENNRLFLCSFIENNYRLSDIESVERDKDGRILHFRNNLIGIVKDNLLICAWGMQKDITRENEIREGLRRSEERLRMASEAGGVGIWEWNITTNELFWSDRLKHIYGFTPSREVTMDDFRLAVHPDDRPTLENQMAEAMNFANKNHLVCEYRVLANNTVKWIQAFGETFFDDTGRPIRMNGTAIDVTESKRAEINANKLRDVSLLLSKAMTLKQLSEIIVEFATQSLHAQAVTVHCASEESFKLQLVQAHGYSNTEIEKLQTISSESRLPIAEAGLKGQALFLHHSRPTCAIPLLLNQRMLGVIGFDYAQAQSFGKDFQRFVLAFADQCAQAFERARLYEMERSARQDAEAANQAKSKFLASMSHEIRTPLGAIIGFAELLNEDGVSDDERSDCIARILRNGHLLADMINDILDLSKIESEKLEVEHIDFELIPLVQEVIGLLELKAQEKNLRLVLAAVGNLPNLVHSDPTRLRQILINLLGNAIKFTDRGRVEIRMACERSDQGIAQLRFTIVDTGVGIPVAQQSRIFEPFLQADSSTTRKFGGTGLGLAVSRGLAQALGGDLQLLKSVVGEGSAFTFTIDIGTTDSLPLSHPDQQSVRKTSTQHELDGLRILVVDDNPDNRTYIGSFLTSAGAMIETAANGLQAINLAHQRDYDIVLMDIQMPELDGFGAMRHLRSQSYAKPVLALTAHAMTGDRENSLNAGFQDHLVKPIDRSSLIQAIKKYTNGSGKSGCLNPLPII